MIGQVVSAPPDTYEDFGETVVLLLVEESVFGIDLFDTNLIENVGESLDVGTRKVKETIV